jgi:hypothetical protein
LTRRNPGKQAALAPGGKSYARFALKGFGQRVSCDLFAPEMLSISLQKVAQRSQGTLGGIEKLFAHNLAVLNRLKPHLFHGEAHFRRLEGDLLLEADDKAITMRPGTGDYGGMNLVVVTIILPDLINDGSRLDEISRCKWSEAARLSYDLKSVLARSLRG